ISYLNLIIREVRHHLIHACIWRTGLLLLRTSLLLLRGGIHGLLRGLGGLRIAALVGLFGRSHLLSLCVDLLLGLVQRIAFILRQALVSLLAHVPQCLANGGASTHGRTHNERLKSEMRGVTPCGEPLLDGVQYLTGRVAVTDDTAKLVTELFPYLRHALTKGPCPAFDQVDPVPLHKTNDPLGLVPEYSGDTGGKVVRRSCKTG